MPWMFAICEDEQVSSNILAELIRRWATKNKREVTIHCFVDSNKLLGAWSDADCFDALFLDIELKDGPDGLTFAENIRKKDKNLPIVFVTNHSDFILKGYPLEALDFLIKPVKEEPFLNCLDRLAYRLELRKVQYFNCKVERETMRFPIRDILCFCSVGHYIHINDDPNLRFREPIDALATRLPPNFARIHRSIIVNMDHVYQYGMQRVVMDDDKRSEHPVGRRYVEAFIKTISEYRRFF